MPDDEVARVRIRDAGVAEVIEHRWLGNAQPSRDVRRCQIEIDQRDSERLGWTRWGLAILTLQGQQRGDLSRQCGSTRPALGREKGDDLWSAEINRRRLTAGRVAL